MTIERLEPEIERTRSTPLSPDIAVSIGKVIRRSTSSGASPSPSVMIETVDRSISGRTSTGTRCS